MRASLQVIQRFHALLEPKDTIDDRVDLVFLIKSKHLLEYIHWTVDNTLECSRPGECEAVDVVSKRMFNRPTAAATDCKLNMHSIQ